MTSQKELVVAGPAGSAGSASSERPVIVFNGLNDEQFDRALQLFSPPPRTKPTLWSRPEYRDNLIKAAAFCEAVMYMRPNGNLFANKSIANHFDGMMIEQYRNDNEDFTFSVNEFYSDTRGELPEELQNWDPKDEKPMPTVTSDVDWADALTDMDLHYPGFLDLMCTCIDLDEKISTEVARYKHSTATTFGDHEGTRMPDPINARANFEEFTPSRLISGGGHSGGLRFGPGTL